MSLFNFLLLSAAIAQASKIVSESFLFERLRLRLAHINEFLGEGISCQLCTGAWVGLVAAAFAPEVIHIEPPVAAWFADGMALAFAGRLLYSVQEAVLASSFWLERSNRENEYTNEQVPEERVDEVIVEQPVVRLARKETPYQEQSLVATDLLVEPDPDADWEEDWRDLPDESEELV